MRIPRRQNQMHTGEPRQLAVRWLDIDAAIGLTDSGLSVSRLRTDTEDAAREAAEIKLKIESPGKKIKDRDVGALALVLSQTGVANNAAGGSDFLALISAPEGVDDTTLRPYPNMVAAQAETADSPADRGSAHAAQI